MGRSGPFYPRLLRDRSIVPKIDMAIRYFESMLGRERRELESEVLIHFFGDHKLARCIVACLARSYRYYPPQLERVVGPASMRSLREAGLDSPRALRLQLFDFVNDVGSGYLPLVERESALGRLEARLRLEHGDLERLLYLDADEYAILERLGAEPRPQDAAAQYNFTVLTTLLRHAELVELTLTGWTPAAQRAALRLCASNGVEAERDADGQALRLRGRQDSLGAWGRHGRRVSRTVIQLLERGRQTVTGGVALVAANDRRARLALTAEVLDILAGAPAPSAGWEAARGWDQETLVNALSGPRSEWGSWRVRRAPEASAWASGVVVPELLLQAGEQRVLLCAVRSHDHGARLAPLAQAATTGEPLVFVGPEEALGPLHAVGATAIGCERFEAGTIVQALSSSHERGSQSAALVGA